MIIGIFSILLAILWPIGELYPGQLYLTPIPSHFLGQISPNATCRYNILVQFLKAKRILKQYKMFNSS